MKKNRMVLILTAITTLFLVNTADASGCDAHYPFDGSLADATGNGYDGMMITDGGPAEPQFGEGKNGQALHITGTAAMRAFLDLHHENCPQFTITAWFKLPSVTEAAPQTILATGAGGGTPALVASGSSLTLYGKGNGLTQKNAIRNGDTWFFVAATFDYAAQEYKLHWRNRSVDGKLAESPYHAEDSFWIGTRSDTLRFTAQDLFIDDVRVYGRVLGLDEIRDVSRNVVAHSGAPPEPGPLAPSNGPPGLPVTGGPGTGIDLPEGATGTQLPLGGSLVLPDTENGDSPDWNDPGPQIADPNSQAVIEGKVIDSNGAPMQDLRIGVTRATNTEYTSTQFLAETRTDANGNYRVAVIASEPVKVTARGDWRTMFPHNSVAWAPGRIEYSDAQSIKISPGEQVEVNISFPLLTCKLSGVVVREPDMRLPGMRVGLYDVDEFNRSRGQAMVSVVADDRGEFEIDFSSTEDWQRVNDVIESGKIDMYLQARDPTGTYAAPSEVIHLYVKESHYGPGYSDHACPQSWHRLELGADGSAQTSEPAPEESATVAAVPQGTCLTGSVGTFGGNFAPRGWAYANGDLLDTQEYSALFSIVGFTYGGDGQSQFALPNIPGPQSTLICVNGVYPSRS